MRLLIWLGSALAGGALARLVTGSRQRGIVGDVILGLIGGICGSYVLRSLVGETAPGSIAHIATSACGAVLVVMASRLVRRRLAPRLEAQLQARLQQIADLERSMIDQILRSSLIHRDPERSYRQQQTLGERLADRVATFGGSWTFLGCFAAFMLAWMFVNTEKVAPADPYPFILLNLILSCIAAVQAPIIMMSQNRQAAKDRFDARQDYEVNLRAETQIAALHAKLDETRTSDIRALIALQERHTAALERLAAAIEGERGGSQ